ncbi:MAG: amidohydrolase family protein [Thermomicrobiales bacterium]
MTAQLIRNGTLIDGNGGDPIPGGALLIENDRISAVGREGTFTVPAGAVEIDAGGGTILPGLIDTHVHIMMEGLNLQKTLTTPFSLNFYQAIEYMRRTLDAGITTVRDAGGADFGVKQAVERGLIVGPRMQISISVLSITGGHGDGWMLSGNEISLFQPYPGNPDGRCDGPEEVRRKVREILRAGAEVIKVCSTGGVGSPTDHPDFTQFSPEELAIMVQEGRYRRGIKVMAHAQGSEGIKNAVRAGIHLDRARLLARRRGDQPDAGARHLPRPHPRRAARRARIGRAIERRARICPAKGPRLPGRAQRQHRLRLPRGCEDRHGHRRRRRAARHQPARTRPDVRPRPDPDGIARRHHQSRRRMPRLAGSHRYLASGKLADAVITRTDPLADIRSLEQTSNIALVMKGGQLVKDIRHA